MGKKKKNKGDMSIGQCMLYTIKIIFKADKASVIFSFYKQISEMLFETFFVVYLTERIFTFIEEGVAYSNLVKIVAIFCSMHIIVHITSAIHAYYIRLQTPKIYKYMYEKVIDKARTIELTRYEQPDFYDKFSRTLDECLKKAVDGLIEMSNAAANIIASVCAISLVAVQDPLLILIIFPPILGTLVFGIMQNKEQLALRREETQSKRATEYVKRVFYEKKYASELRLYGITNVLFKKHRENFIERGKINVRHKIKITIYDCLGSLVVLLPMIGSYVYVAYRIKISGAGKLGIYIALISAIGFMSWLVRSAVRHTVNSGKFCVYMQNLKEFIEYDPGTIVRGNRTVDGQLGNIEFKNVNFTYAGADKSVINNLNLHVTRGEKIALVGENGAGKTTLIKLLMGLYPVTDGEVIVDGHDVNEYDPHDYHKHLGAVFQDLQIFSLPLSENVLMHEPVDDREREIVKDSLIKAQFGDKLSELPDGIDTMVTKEFDEKGFVCSGGQAQKIAIARVFAKNPDIVILDEPSSALDPIAEYNMYNNMLQVSEGKTVFFISHRLSSARIADKIYFLENGTIVEQGSHDELMKADGRYAKMFHLQAQNYQDDVLKHLNLHDEVKKRMGEV